MSKDGKVLYARLEPTEMVEFEQVKQYYGINTSTKVVRYLIRQEARRLASMTTPLHQITVSDVVHNTVVVSLLPSEILNGQRMRIEFSAIINQHAPKHNARCAPFDMGSALTALGTSIS